jgi:hypothetical protein
MRMTRDNDRVGANHSSDDAEYADGQFDDASRQTAPTG